MIQLPKIVAARLREMSSSEHPDSDLLAAFTEGSLTRREHERISHHLAACAECRQVVMLALPETAPGALSSPVPKPRTWLHAPVLRWGALAACITVVAAAVLLHRGEQPRNEVAQVAMEPSAPMTHGLQTRDEPVQAEPAKPRTKAKIAQPGESAGQMAANSPASPSVAPSANTVSSDLARKSDTLAQGQAGTATPEPAPSSRVDKGFNTDSRGALAKAAPPFTPRPTTETAASTYGGAAKLTDLRPPSWRLSEQDGLPERSFSTGQWEKIQVDHKTGFRAIAAQGMEVWVGGPSGLLYHSGDMGLNWTRMIPVSSGTTLNGDVTQIAFSDHLHGTVTTAAGQTWITSDAGKTWEVH